MLLAEHRRQRAGAIWLLAGLVLLALASLTSVLTGNWRFLLVASPLFMLGFTLGLIVLVQPSHHA